MDTVGFRLRCGLGVLLAAALWASRATAQDTAYGHLLDRHVRAVTIAGIALNAVDYAALAADPAYAQALADLRDARPDALALEPASIAFWVNAYNLLAIKAVVDRYPVRSIRDGGTLLQSIWKKKIGMAGGRELSLDDIEHDILRSRFREPRIHMAIVCASLSCPDLRREPYVADRLGAQLDAAARRFLANPRKGVMPEGDGRTAKVSSIFKWFSEDFGGADGVVRFIQAHTDPDLRQRVAALGARGLSYLDYDWSLNDARRALAERAAR